MNDTLAVCRYHAKTLAIEIDETGIEPIGRVAGTAAGWQTIVLNLINNAVEHAPAGSTVKARLFPAGGSVVFETENEGSAIAAEIEDRLFENFVSVGGTGLGLGLVARRVGELGGTITLDNVKDRIVFRVSSPVMEPNPASTEQEEES